MLLDYYKLVEQPFGVTPDSRFLYLGPKHREALASLVYGTESNRGFLAMIARPGMGKTSLLYHYLSYLRDKARTAFVFRTDCDSREFIRHLLLDLGIDTAGMDLPAMHDALNRLLTEEMHAGRRFVLVIDEAQNLDEKVLEVRQAAFQFRDAVGQADANSAGGPTSAGRAFGQSLNGSAATADFDVDPDRTLRSRGCKCLHRSPPVGRRMRADLIIHGRRAEADRRTQRRHSAQHQ